MKRILLSLSILLGMSSFAQNDAIFLEFQPKVGGMDYTLGATVQDLSGTAFYATDFNYYISELHVIHDGGQDLDLSDTVFIVKGDAYGLFLGHFSNVTTVEQINFGVGVPQALNHLDISQYPSGHPLSFHVPSMHWGWTSGYKFLLCDGQGDQNGDGTPETLFQLHNLGDANFKNVQLPISATDYGTHKTIVVNCNMDEWIYGANPGTVGIQHGETGINASTQNNVAVRNVFTSPANAGISTINELAKIYFVNSSKSIKVVWEDLTGIARYEIVDMNGRVISSDLSNQVNGEVVVEDLRNGQYIFTAFNKDNQKIKTLLMVH